uniref:Thioredoxin domain-containing protein 3 n=1 Tax=Schizaphis graminum TaxID=13262 RepID=A0A2S2NCL2_SCHGA
MAKRGALAVLQEEVNNNDDWARVMGKPGMLVIDVYAEWCGPCVAMISYLRKIKLESGNENLNYAIAKSDDINVLKRFRQRSEPHWMFFFDGKLVNVVIGIDAPRLIRLIWEELEQYAKYKNGEIQKEFVSIQYGIYIFVHRYHHKR